MDDISTLAEHNTRFIQACRQGSWEVLQPLLTRSCSYLDGATGKPSDMERYIKDVNGCACTPASGRCSDADDIGVCPRRRVSPGYGDEMTGCG
jgi:hypothetical protein